MLSLLFSLLTLLSALLALLLALLLLFAKLVYPRNSRSEANGWFTGHTSLTVALAQLAKESSRW